jgi:hypothetical protein
MGTRHEMTIGSHGHEHENFKLILYRDMLQSVTGYVLPVSGQRNDEGYVKVYLVGRKPYDSSSDWGVWRPPIFRSPERGRTPEIPTTNVMFPLR